MEIRILENKPVTLISYDEYNQEKDSMTLEELNNDYIIFGGSKSDLLFAEELANRLMEQRKYRFGEPGDQIVFLEEILEAILNVKVELDKPYYYEEGEWIEFDWELVGLKSGPVFITPAYIIRFHPTHY